MADVGPSFGAESESSAAESVRSFRRRVCRYKPGFWLESQFEPALLTDLTNYPAELREDIIAAIVRTHASSSEQTHSATCTCASCLTEALAHLFGFREKTVTDEDELLVVDPSNILPRYFWYKHELLACHGQAAIVSEEQTDLCLESDDDDVIEVEGEEEDAAGTVAGAVHPPPVAEEGMDITDEVVKSKKKRVTIIRTNDQSAETASTLQTSGNILKGLETHTDSFTTAIRDLQFRLNKHGFLADPRTYLGKGREEMYDKNDSLFDEEECIPILESDESSDGSDHQSNEGTNEDTGIIYQEGEHLFVMDDESEVEEEQIAYESRAKDIRNAPRVLIQCEYARPTQLMQWIYHPRGWRAPSRKLPGKLPELLRVFFHTLEYVISHKKLQLLQKCVYDTYEFVSVSPTDPNSLRLNDYGKKQLSYIMELIFQTALLSFLMPYSPDSENMPKFLKYLKKPAKTEASNETLEQPAPKDEDFFPIPALPLSSILKELATRYISTFLPTDEAFYKKIWLTILEHTISVKEHRESLWLRELVALFERETTKAELKAEKGVEAAIEVSKFLIVRNEEVWKKFLESSTSVSYLTAIEQMRCCASAMVHDSCPADWRQLAVDELLSRLPKSEQEKLGQVDGQESLINCLVEIPIVTFAVSPFLSGMKGWWTSQLIEESKDTSPTSPSEGSKTTDDEEAERTLLLRFEKLDELEEEAAGALRAASFTLPSNLQPSTPISTAKAQSTIIDYLKAFDPVTDATTGKRRRETNGPDKSVALMVDSDRGQQGDKLSEGAIPEGQSEKKKRTRVLITDILQTHYSRVIDLLQASPLPLPIPFGIAIQCSKVVGGDQPSSSVPSTSHIMIVLLHKFESISTIDLELLNIDPPLPDDCQEELFTSLCGDSGSGRSFKELKRISSLSDFLDQVHSCKRLTVEGRARSLVFAGFDNRTKSFSLLSFPLSYPHVTCNSGPGESIKSIQGSKKMEPSLLRREDFISSETTSVKGRLSLLDFLSLHLWLQIFSDLKSSGQMLLLPLVFSGNDGIAGETRVSPALTKAILNGGDLQKEWKAILDRYSFNQLNYLKKWVCHLKRIVVANVADNVTVTYGQMLES